MFDAIAGFFGFGQDDTDAAGSILPIATPPLPPGVPHNWRGVAEGNRAKARLSFPCVGHWCRSGVAVALSFTFGRDAAACFAVVKLVVHTISINGCRRSNGRRISGSCEQRIESNLVGARGGPDGLRRGDGARTLFPELNFFAPPLAISGLLSAAPRTGLST